MEKTSTPIDLRSIIVSVNLHRSPPKNLDDFKSNEFIELVRSSGLKIEDHFFSNQNTISVSHFLTKGNMAELKTLVTEKNI